MHTPYLHGELIQGLCDYKSLSWGRPRRQIKQKGITANNLHIHILCFFRIQVAFWTPLYSILSLHQAFNSTFSSTLTSPVSDARYPSMTPCFHQFNMRTLWAFLPKAIEVSKRTDRNLEGFTSSLTAIDLGASQTAIQFWKSHFEPISSHRYLQLFKTRLHKSAQ